MTQTADQTQLQAIIDAMPDPVVAIDGAGVVVAANGRARAIVPELRVQQDFVPGLDLSIHFTATKVGKYEIVCTQLCGLGHYNMKAYLNVMSQPDYDAWIKQQAAMQ